jgi:hypothetical protein
MQSGQRHHLCVAPPGDRHEAEDGAKAIGSSPESLASGHLSPTSSLGKRGAPIWAAARYAALVTENTELPLGDLAAPEQLALAALLRLLVRLDGQFTSEEQEALQDLALTMGERQFWRVMDEAGQTLPDDESIRQSALSVTNQASREIIYMALLRVAESDVIQTREASLLDWLLEHWGLKEIIGPSRG